MLELSNFLLPSCWASAPLGSFVPDNRIESEVARATKCRLENEKRLYLKTSESRAGVFHLLCETFTGSLAWKLSLLYPLGMLRRPQLEQSLPLPWETHSQEPTYRRRLCEIGCIWEPLISSFVPSGVSGESYSFFPVRQNDMGSPHIHVLDLLPPNNSKWWSPLIPLSTNLLLAHVSAACFLGWLW